MTGCSLALGWVLQGLGIVELRRNEVEIALPTRVWARLNIMRMPQTQLLSRLLLGEPRVLG